MVTHRQRYREKSPRWSVGALVCTVQYSAFARHWQPLPVYRRLADNACWSHLFLRKHYRSFQLHGVRHLLADPLPADLYRRLPEADEVLSVILATAE